ncbi:thioredoxin family protein [Desulfococcaceae bacterium HSG8]|nr:thioredoxin family protein [Desulfococcaceae bacterium HSG8]
MTTVNLESVDELQNAISNNDIVVIDFWADWCGPCKMFGPTYEKISEKYPDMMFTKCDTEKGRPLAAAFGIQSIPTLAIFREKILVFKQAGAVSEVMLDDLISKVRTLDMDEIRTKIAEEQSADKNKE